MRALGEKSEVKDLGKLHYFLGFRLIAQEVCR